MTDPDRVSLCVEVCVTPINSTESVRVVISRLDAEWLLRQLTAQLKRARRIGPTPTDDIKAAKGDRR